MVLFLDKNKNMKKEFLNFNEFVNEGRKPKNVETPAKNSTSYEVRTIKVPKPQNTSKPYYENVKVKIFVVDGIEYGYDEISKEYYDVYSGLIATPAIQKDDINSKNFEQVFIDYNKAVQKSKNPNPLSDRTSLWDSDKLIKKITTNMAKFAKGDFEQLQSDGNFLLKHYDFEKSDFLQITPDKYKDLEAVKAAFPNAVFFDKSNKYDYREMLKWSKHLTTKVADSPGAKAEMDALTSRLERDIAKGKFKNNFDYR
jgi:hypothetical protein